MFMLEAMAAAMHDHANATLPMVLIRSEKPLFDVAVFYYD